jgi:putative membrane protein insertion efficiency factor
MKSFFTIILFLWTGNSFGQNLPESLRLPLADPVVFMEQPARFPHSKTPLKQSSNELEAVLFLAFDTYKNYFSSQDINSCSFYPSCSGYGLAAVKKHGVVMGMVRTFDRLSRCHGFSSELYEIDKVKRLQIDHP